MEFTQQVDDGNTISLEEQTETFSNGDNVSLTTGAVKKATVVMPTDTGLSFCGDCDPEAEQNKAPVERIVLPADVAEFSPEDEMLYIIGTREGKVTQIAGLEKMQKLKVSTLSQLITGIASNNSFYRP